MIIQETTKKIRMIRGKVKKAHDRQKIYADNRRRPLEFEEGDNVFMKVTPRLRLKGSFKSQKLSLRYVGSYQIIERGSSLHISLTSGNLFLIIFSLFSQIQWK